MYLHCNTELDHVQQNTERGGKNTPPPNLLENVGYNIVFGISLL